MRNDNESADDFSAEVEALSHNQEFMKFLEQRSQSTQRLSLNDARKRIGLS